MHNLIDALTQSIPEKFHDDHIIVNIAAESNDLDIVPQNDVQ